MKWLKKLFKSKPKPYLLDGKYEIIPAFEWQGQTYYMHKDPLNTAAGRGMTALVFMEELLQRCSVDYLRDHITAMDKVLSNPAKISIPDIVKLNMYLRERVELLAALPDHIYKLASVVFFTEHESPFRYDYKTGMEKVEAWKQDPELYGFFLQQPLSTLIPSLQLPEAASPGYLRVVEKVDQMHMKYLRSLLSEKT